MNRVKEWIFKKSLKIPQNPEKDKGNHSHLAADTIHDRSEGCTMSSKQTQ